MLNVQAFIRLHLEKAGCTIDARNGFWYVTTPEGDVWDMTICLPVPT